MCLFNEKKNIKNAFRSGNSPSERPIRDGFLSETEFVSAAYFAITTILLLFFIVLREFIIDEIRIKRPPQGYLNNINRL